jgi:cytochrome c oxidase subunit 2
VRALNPAPVRDNRQPMSAVKKFLASVGAAGLALAGAVPALADTDAKGQSSIDPAGPAAQHIRDLWMIVTIPALIVLLAVGGAIIYAAFRFKERDPKFMPKQIGGNNAMEFTWTVIPALVLFILFGISVPQMFYLRHSPAPTGLHITVYGQRYSWSFLYPNVKKEVFDGSVLYIPAGQPVNLDIKSKDVIHSFSVPRLAGRLDAIPGQTNTLWLQADQPGTYYGQCTELCGTGHATMLVTVKALSAADWQAWYTKLQRGGR